MGATGQGKGGRGLGSIHHSGGIVEMSPCQALNPPLISTPVPSPAWLPLCMMHAFASPS